MAAVNLPLFLFAMLTLLAAGAIAQTFEEQLSANYTVRWTPNYELERVYFEVVVRTKSYVGLGISPSGRMIGSDVVIGGVYSDGRRYFTDNHVNDSPGSTPQLDASQDYHLTFAYENDTHTELHFYRAFDTGDAVDDHVIDGNPTYFIYAIGGYDPMVPDDIVIHHGPLRGSRAVTILDSNMLPPRDPCIPVSPQQKELQLGENYHLRWYADLNTQLVEFYVTVTGSLTNGFIALGFSSAPDGVPTDTFIGGRYANGTNYFGDHYSFGLAATPIRDPVQNYIPLSLVKVNATHTEFSFSRSFDTGDYQNDYNPISAEPVHLVWSYGDTEELYSNGATQRGQALTRILEPLPEICNEQRKQAV